MRSEVNEASAAVRKAAKGLLANLESSPARAAVETARKRWQDLGAELQELEVRLSGFRTDRVELAGEVGRTLERHARGIVSGKGPIATLFARALEAMRPTAPATEVLQRAEQLLEADIASKRVELEAGRAALVKAEEVADVEALTVARGFLSATLGALEPVMVAAREAQDRLPEQRAIQDVPPILVGDHVEFKRLTNAALRIHAGFVDVEAARKQYAHAGIRL